MLTNNNHIIHIDMDAFFASIEQRDHPQYQNKPLVVGGSPNSRSVVSTASYEARTFGIHSGMSCYQAKKLCPHAIFISPDLSKYHAVSRVLHQIFHEVTDIIEPLSLDEAYLDIRENKFDEPLALNLVHYIKSRIKGQLNLTASAGISSIKFTAKLASAMNKPNGTTIIDQNEVPSFIAPLSIKKLWGVGTRHAETFHKLGIHKIEDLRKKNIPFLLSHFGHQGAFFFNLAHGRDDRQVTPSTASKSIAKEQTYSTDLQTLTEKKEKLSHLSFYLHQALIKKNMQAKRISIKIKFFDFSLKTKSITLPTFIHSHSELEQISWQLFRSVEESEKKAIRLLGITASVFNNSPTSTPDQLDLFNDY